MTHTLQAMSEYERKHWVEAMGGTWPALSTLQRIRADSVEDNLNSIAFSFLKDCLVELESRGLTDQGLYRVGGVLSKVKKLLNRGLDPQPNDGPLELNDPKMWESKTVASAVKQYFRDLSKPLLTHHLYPDFVEAVKHENEAVRVQELQKVVRKLPVASREILKVLIKHLSKVAAKSEHNLVRFKLILQNLFFKPFAFIFYYRFYLTVENIMGLRCHVVLPCVKYGQKYNLEQITYPSQYSM